MSFATIRFDMLQFQDKPGFLAPAPASVPRAADSGPSFSDGATSGTMGATVFNVQPSFPSFTQAANGGTGSAMIYVPNVAPQLLMAANQQSLTMQMITGTLKGLMTPIHS